MLQNVQMGIWKKVIKVLSNDEIQRKSRWKIFVWFFKCLALRRLFKKTSVEFLRYVFRWSLYRAPHVSYVVVHSGRHSYRKDVYNTSMLELVADNACRFGEGKFNKLSRLNLTYLFGDDMWNHYDFKSKC